MKGCYECEHMGRNCTLHVGLPRSAGPDPGWLRRLWRWLAFGPDGAR